MNNQIEEIKEKLDIIEFIGQFVELKKSGRNFKGLCPFHQEKSPSFVVSPDRQIWHCFGTCGIGGDVITFKMKWENLTFYEALRELADQVGVKLEDSSYDDKQWKRKELLYSINNMALKYYSYLLTKTKYGKKAMEYLLERGINEKIISTFELGYAPASWDSLLKFLQKKGFSPQDIAATGLVIQSGSRMYDRFRNRLAFPLKDAKGNVVGFSGRLLDNTKKEAKYVNTPETEIYHKRENLFGIHLTRDAIRKADNVYVVEGEFDMITPFQHGISNVVAIKGAAFTEEQLGVLKRYTKRITLALDMDDAGVEAMKRGIRSAEKLDFEVYVATFTSGKDPDEAIKTDEVQFKKDLKQAMPVYDFLLEDIQKKYPEKNSFQKKKIGEEIMPFIRDINNPIVQSHYMKIIAEMLDVSQGSLYRLMRDSRTRFKKKPQDVKPEQKIARKELIQRYLLSNLLQNSTKEPASSVFSIVRPGDFSIPSYTLIAEALEKQFMRPETYDYTAFAQSLKPELQSVADELFMFTAATEEEQPDLTKLALEIRMNKIKLQMDTLMESNDRTDEKNLSDLSKEYNDLRKKLK